MIDTKEYGSLPAVLITLVPSARQYLLLWVKGHEEIDVCLNQSSWTLIDELDKWSHCTQRPACSNHHWGRMWETMVFLFLADRYYKSVMTDNVKSHAIDTLFQSDSHGCNNGTVQASNFLNIMYMQSYCRPSFASKIWAWEGSLHSLLMCVNLRI